MCVHDTVRAWHVQALNEAQLQAALSGFVTAMPGGWDFSEAHGLLDSFAYPKNKAWVANLSLSSLCARPVAPKDGTRPRNATLGNFDKLFEQAPLVSGLIPTRYPLPLPPPVPAAQDKTARDFQLRLQLISSFPEDRQWLQAAALSSNHYTTNREDGIHIFIDYSNISIGYMQKVQNTRTDLETPIRGRANVQTFNQVSHLRHDAKSRGESLWMNIQLSFESLVLLLERGRPVAKRVLAGSTRHDPAIAKAKAIGYDVKILEKVYKDEGVHERDRRAAALASPYNTLPPPPDRQTLSMVSSKMNVSPRIAKYLVASSKAPSVPITPPTSAQSSPDRAATAASKSNGRWVEQAVDEILHNKIYESVIDAAVPSTIVLATGDGAAAEFSDGFVAAVERALNRGWKVELVAWRKTTNYHWRSREWKKKWGDRFRIIQLDGWEGFLEEERM